MLNQMNKVFVIGLLMVTSSLFGQTRLYCNTKEVCKTTSDDTSDCVVYVENSIFEIDNKKSVINYTSGKIVVTYYIEIEIKQDRLDTLKFSTHTNAGEKLNILIDTKVILVSSLNYPNTTFIYRISP